ncbi:MAG TPA: hypothetical protein VKK31_23105 [Thermoanaerobaculia bacterium]|nr:hypothetical protein [Thermoanaerobaculia bacterium]
MAYHGAHSNELDDGALTERGHARGGEIMRLKIRVSMTLTFCLLAGGAGAQVFQYTPPGGPRELETRKEALARELEAARYHLGPVRIAPWATLQDVSYVRNLFATGPTPPDDVTATLGAGFRAYLHSGPKATWVTQVLPEYVWWSQQSDRRRINGRYFLDFYGFFNRLTLEAHAGREQRQRILTPEVPVPATNRRDGGEIFAEVETTQTLFAFTRFTFARQETLTDAVADPRTSGFSLLDRDEQVLQAGLSWRPRQPWALSVGVERTQEDFDSDALDRSSSGTSPVVGVHFQGRRVDFQVDLADRSLKASRGSLFVPYDKVTGNAALTLRGKTRLSTTLYANRNILYSVSASHAYFTEDKLGAALRLALGRRTEARVFAEAGTHDFIAFAAGAPPFEEDVSSYGGSVLFRLWRNLEVGLQAVHSEIDFGLPGGSLSYTTVGTTVNLLGEFGSR